MRLATLLLAFALQQQEQPGSIEGTITAGGEPKPGMRVSIGKQETKTNAAGKYTLRDVPAGRYPLHVGQPRGAAVPLSRTITVTPGQSVNADFLLTLYASLSGVILDEFDEPVFGAEVLLLACEYGGGAPRYFRRNATASNDQGAYRFDYVQPGTAYLLMVLPSSNRRAAPMSDAPTDPRLRRPATLPTLFPAVSDYAGAMAITLRPGEHREGINVRTLRAPSYCVEAQLAGSNVSFQIYPAQVPFGLSPNGGTTGMPRTTKPGADGKVRVCELPPTEYRLIAFEGDVNEPLSFASATVSISNRDATNVLLQPVPRFQVPVELTWAGDPPAKPVEAKLSVVLQSMTRSFGSSAHTPASATPPASLEIKDVLTDDYYTRIFGINGRLYVKEIHYGSENITHAPFHPGTKHDGATLRVVIGHDGAQIKARVHDRNGKPVPGATVVAMPAVFGSESELASALRTGLADQYGNYESTRAVAPGKYYILALTNPLPGALPADEVLRLINLRNQAREVTLQPGATAELELESGPW